MCVGIWSRIFYEPKNWKNRSKIIMRLEERDREQNEFESLNEVTSMRRWLHRFSNTE
jgi:hypothetical protein